MGLKFLSIRTLYHTRLNFFLQFVLLANSKTTYPNLQELFDQLHQVEKVLFVHALWLF